MFGKIKHIHLVGIGGTGMSGIAELLLNLGYRVSGSDISTGDVTQRLVGLGGRVDSGRRLANNLYCPQQCKHQHFVLIQ